VRIGDRQFWIDAIPILIGVLVGVLIGSSVSPAISFERRILPQQLIELRSKSRNSVAPNIDNNGQGSLPSRSMSDFLAKPATGPLVLTSNGPALYFYHIKQIGFPNDRQS
jgi:hypothetical protein